MVSVVKLRTVAVSAIALVVFVGLISGGALESTSVAASCPNASLRVGASTELPDCRAYEQVSPTDKGGFAAYPKTSPATQVSLSGEALEYTNFQAFPGAVGNTAAAAAHVSTRTVDGWQTAEWTPKVPKAEVLLFYILSYTFSPDLTQAILRVPLIPLTPGATPYVQNLFHRDASGAYSLITSNPPAIPPEAICELEELVTCNSFADISAFAGASTDFSHVFFESNAQFTENAPPTFTESLYENTGGSVRLVGILPDGLPAASSTAGARSSAFYETSFKQGDLSVERAVTPNGLHVIFQAPADGGAPDPEQNGLTEVYVRINGADTIEISKPAPGATPAVSSPEPATFQTASVDGSRVFFTSSAELTSTSNTGEANNSESLYEYDLETGQLADLTLDTNPPDAATGPMAQGVIDSSADGSYVYFVANGQLVEGKGIDGQPNIYMVHNGAKPVFIATLSGQTGECRHLVDPCTWSPYPAERAAYVTPDGKHMAFMSSKSLATVNFPGGYNNVDQETGAADSEVYEYTAPTKPEGTGQLICASCDPTGTQPIGNAVMGGISPTIGGNEGETVYKNLDTPFYRVRALSENGRRLFYAAPSSATKTYNSVYEYEQDGEGTCADVRNCHILLSSPESTESDYFLGSSADGSNVFIATSSRLTSTDTDNVRDVYDARVDGGIATPVPPLCEHSCYRPGGLGSSVSPESSATAPSGNLPSPPPSKKCKKGFKVTQGGKCVKAKKQTKKKSKHRRWGKSRTQSTRKHRSAR
jgi:hypothetical protein